MGGEAETGGKNSWRVDETKVSADWRSPLNPPPAAH